MKATLVLLPLLGITYMLFFVNPGGEDEVAQIVFIYFNSILESFQVYNTPLNVSLRLCGDANGSALSLQGFFVSVFYCFLNSEVSRVVSFSTFSRWSSF